MHPARAQCNQTATTSVAAPNAVTVRRVTALQQDMKTQEIRSMYAVGIQVQHQIIKPDITAVVVV